MIDSNINEIGELNEFLVNLNRDLKTYSNNLEELRNNAYLEQEYYTPYMRKHIETLTAAEKMVEYTENYENQAMKDYREWVESL